MTNIIEANHITLKVPGREAPIVQNTTLQIKKGEFVMLLGHNGSGKSSLIKLLSGARQLTSGTIFLNGIMLGKLDPLDKARDIVTISQKAEDRLFVDLSLEENVTLWESRFMPHERKSFEEVIALSNIPSKLITHGKQYMMNFSGGEKQLILLTLALSHPPKVLFLDEHTASLDPKAAQKVMEATAKAIDEYKITTVMVTHQLKDALDYGTRLIIMNEGKIAFDMQKPAGLSENELRNMMD